MSDTTNTVPTPSPNASVTEWVQAIFARVGDVPQEIAALINDPESGLPAILAALLAVGLLINQTNNGLEKAIENLTKSVDLLLGIRTNTARTRGRMTTMPPEPSEPETPPSNGNDDPSPGE